MATFVILLDETERCLRRERVFRDRTFQLDTLSDSELISRYRMPRHALITLTDKVRDSLQCFTRRSRPISPETQVLLTLRYLSKGEFLSEISDLHGVAKSSASRCIHKTVKSICNTLNNINYPTDKNELRSIQHGFFLLARFPRVIGAIDGTLIQIKKPQHDELAYVCRKGYHAINVQAICDVNLR